MHMATLCFGLILFAIVVAGQRLHNLRHAAYLGGLAVLALISVFLAAGTGLLAGYLLLGLVEHAILLATLPATAVLFLCSHAVPAWYIPRGVRWYRHG